MIAEISTTTIALAGISVMGTVVVFLFRLLWSQQEKQELLAERVGRLEGGKEGVERLSAETMELVHKHLAGDCKPKAD